MSIRVGILASIGAFIFAAATLSAAPKQDANPVAPKAAAPKDVVPKAEDQVVIDQPALVFVRATPKAMSKAIADLKKKHDQDSVGEIASDVGYYEMTASDYAAGKKMKVIETDKAVVIFKKKGGEVRLENKNDSIASQVYMFDGVKDPRLVQEIALFSDGREYSAYFGAKP